MININFGQNGGFPLSQDKLALMQESYVTVREAILEMTASYGLYTILAGVELQPDGSYTAGIIKWDDKICRFGGSDGDVKVNLAIENLTDVYFDNVQRIYAQRIDVVETAGAGIMLSSMKRVALIEVVEVYEYELEGDQTLIAHKKGNQVTLTGDALLVDGGIQLSNGHLKLNVEHRPLINQFAVAWNRIGASSAQKAIGLRIYPSGDITPDVDVSGTRAEFNVTYYV